MEGNMLKYQQIKEKLKNSKKNYAATLKKGLFALVTVQIQYK